MLSPFVLGLLSGGLVATFLVVLARFLRPLVMAKFTPFLVAPEHGAAETPPALRDATNRFKTLVENMPLALIEWDANFKVKQWSKQAEKIFGYRSDEVVGLNLQEINFVHDEDRDKVRETTEQLLDGSNPFVICLNRNWTKDRRVIHCNWFNSILFDTNGALEAILSLVLDVTEQQRTTISLQESEQRFRTLFEQSPLSIHILSREGAVLKANQAWEQLWNTKVDEIPHYNALEDPQLIDQGIVPYLQRAFAGETVTFPTAQIDPSLIARERQFPKDSVRWVSGVAYPFLNYAGKVSEVVVIREDITARTHAEMALRKSETQLRLMADSIPQLVFSTTKQGQFSWWNRRWADYVGLTAETMNTQAWKHFGGPEEKPRLFERVKAHLATEIPWEEIFLLRRHDGEYRTHLGVSVPIKNHQGEVVNWLVTATDITESMEADQRLRLAIDVAGIGILAINYSSNTVVPDQKAAEIFGLKYNETVSRQRIHDCFHPNDQAEIHRRIEKSLDPNGMGTFSMEHRIVRSDGSTRWINVGKSVRFENSRAARAVLAAVDITNRKLAEIAVARSEAEYRTLFEMAGMANGEARLDTGEIVRVNQKFCEMLGYTAGEVIGKTFLELTHPDDISRSLEAIETSLTSGNESYILEKRYIRKDGSPVWASLTATFLSDDLGQPKNILANIQDITARKQLEERTRETELRFRTFMENNPTYAYIKDSKSRYVYVNQKTATIVSSVNPTEMIGKTDFDFFSKHDAHALRKNDRIVMRRKQPSQFLEMINSKQGRLYFLAFKFPLEGSDGQMLLAGISVDVTTQYRAEQDLIEADKRKNQFLATLAHELRNPLAPIRNAVQILKMKDSADPELIWVQKMLARQVSHMSRLLDDLIDVSRISRQRLELRKSRIVLSTVLESAVETSRPLIDAQQHEFSMDVAETPIFLDGDFVRLSQVFSNLLNNAAKYTPNGGQIRLSARLQRDHAIVLVQDSGIGFKPDAKNSLFDMFWQGTSSLSHSEGGLGIGLSLVKGIVELHGGKVDAHSEGPGKGSEFIVQLPAIPAISVDDSHERESEIKNSAPIRRVLVVDDNRDSADSMALQLRLKGHDVQTAYSGEQALEVAITYQPEFILLDIGLPGMSGHDVARTIRQQSWGASPVLIAMTGWGQLEDRSLASDAGFDHHMTKPLDPDELDALLVAKSG